MPLKAKIRPIKIFNVPDRRERKKHTAGENTSSNSDDGESKIPLSSSSQDEGDNRNKGSKDSTYAVVLDVDGVLYRGNRCVRLYLPTIVCAKINETFGVYVLVHIFL